MDEDEELQGKLLEGEKCIAVGLVSLGNLSRGPDAKSDLCTFKAISEVDIPHGGRECTLVIDDDGRRGKVVVDRSQTKDYPFRVWGPLQ